MTDIDDCVASPCKNNGTCVDQVDGYICLCDDGYEGDNCDDNTDDCAETPCLNGGTCNDEVNGYDCDCAPGYAGPTCGIGMFSAIQKTYARSNLSFSVFAPIVAPCSKKQ